MESGAGDQKFQEQTKNILLMPNFIEKEANVLHAGVYDVARRFHFTGLRR
jgi:hypothetical protein